MQRTFRDLIYTYVNRRGPLLAQGIAYSLLIGSMPLVLLAAAVAGYLYGTFPQLQLGLHRKLLLYVPEEVARSLLSQVDHVASGWAGMGIVSVVGLLFVSKSIFDALSSGLAGMMEGSRQRSYWANQACTFLLTLFAVALFIAISLDDMVIHLALARAGLHAHAWLYRAMSSAFSVLLLAVGLLLIYLVFSHVKLHFWRTLATAIVVSLLWHAAGYGGRLLVNLSARYRLIYGVLAGIVLFLFWLRIFAHLVLMGGLFVAWRNRESERPNIPPV
jgi:membrane protein